MKRTGFKRPIEGPKLASKARKKPKAPSVLRSLKNKTWELCKAIIKAKYGNICYTCGNGPLSGSGRHTGHFIPRSGSGVLLKYKLENLRPQCYNCNINLGGNGANFYRKLVEIEGQQYVDDLFALKNVITKETKDFYYDLIAEYKKILSTLQPSTLEEKEVG